MSSGGAPAAVVRTVVRLMPPGSPRKTRRGPASGGLARARAACGELAEGDLDVPALESGAPVEIELKPEATYRRQTFLTDVDVRSALREAIGTLRLAHAFVYRGWGVAA